MHILTNYNLEPQIPPKEGSFLYYVRRRWWARPVYYCGILLYHEEVPYIYSNKKTEYTKFIDYEIQHWFIYDKNPWSHLYCWQPTLTLPEHRLRLMKNEAEKNIGILPFILACRVYQSSGLPGHFLSAKTPEQLFWTLSQSGY